MAEIAVPASLKSLIPRLPRTFGPALNEQFRNWDLLFPAERRQLQAQMEWLARLPQREFTRLFAQLVDVENRMDLPRWDSRSGRMTVEDSGILARSPLYPQWRGEVEKVFGQIDDGVQTSGALASAPRLLICVLPSGIKLPAEPLWPDLEKSGTWVQLDRPFGRMLPGLAAALVARKAPPSVEDVENTWIFECETRFSPLAESSSVTVLSWEALAATRREFLSHLNTVARSLKSVDQTNEELRRIDMSRLLGPPLGARPRIREFVRTLLLSGNGSLVFNNSFVQWGASEAVRRVQPQVLIAVFGIRQKLKPFSSSVLFEDQTRSNPVPDEDDPAGSAVDALMLASYVYLASQRVNTYASKLMTLMSAGDLDRVLVLGAKPAELPHGKAAPDQFTSAAMNWLTAAR